jgi:hypothetical protein
VKDRREPHFDLSSEQEYKGKDLIRFARRYDLGAISPRTMIALSTELFASGFLTPDQHEDLSFQSELMPNFDTTIGALTGEKAEPDRVRNFTDIWRQRLEFEKKHVDASGRLIKRTKKILDLLESIENQPKQSKAMVTIEQIKQLNKHWEDRAKVPLKLPPLGLNFD